MESKHIFYLALAAIVGYFVSRACNEYVEFEKEMAQHQKEVEVAMVCAKSVSQTIRAVFDEATRKTESAN